LQLLINDGHGKFTDETATRITGPTQGVNASSPIGSYTLRQTSILDVDGDGTEDIVAEGAANDSLAVSSMVFLNDGAGHFALAQTIPPAHIAINVANIGNDLYFIERTTESSLGLERSTLPDRYMSFDDTGLTGSGANDRLFLYGTGSSVPSTQIQNFSTTIEMSVHGPIVNGLTPSLHFYVNGKDYGVKTMTNVFGFVYQGKNYTKDETFTITLPGVAAITELRVVADNDVNDAYIGSVKVNGVALQAATYHPAAGGTVDQTFPSAQYDHGYTVVNAAPWNTALAARKTGTAAQPIEVKGGGGIDTVHVLGMPSAYTITGVGTATIRFSESSGLNQNATLFGISRVVFQDGTVRNIGP
jgi:hypothetical protein